MKKKFMPLALLLAAALALSACTGAIEKATEGATNAPDSTTTETPSEDATEKATETEAETPEPETEPETDPPVVYEPDHDYKYGDDLNWSHQVVNDNTATYTLNGNEYTIDLAMEASYERVIGFCCGWYTLNASTSALNVRDKPSADSTNGGTKITSFSSSDYFLILGMPETGGGTWARVYYQGQILYLSASYITPYTGNGEENDVTVPPEGNEQPTNPAIVIPAPTGTTSQYVESIKAPDGSDSGVYLYTFNFTGEYGNDKQALVLAGSLANTKLSLQVINCGEYIVSQQTVDAASKTYSSQHPGQTVLGAVNGDLWMTRVHSGTNVTQKVLAVTRGILMIDGEIWATQQFGMENYGATNDENGVSTPPKNALGVTASNQPIVGIPEITVNVKNVTKNSSFNAAGLNRLPALNSIVVYNNRCYTTNYALTDSYEVAIETTGGSAFTLNGKVTGTVKGIYESGSTARASLDANTIIITARGDKIEAVKAAFAVGDKVEFSCSLIDMLGNTELWYQVTDAMGGHMQTLFNGKGGALGDTSEYPTTIVGYRDDGTVMLMTVNSTNAGSYKGLRFSQAVAFCKELGFNSAFYLDGGGSATMACMTGENMIVRNNGSDGSARAVINAIGFVWNDTPVCDTQGDLSYIKVLDAVNYDPYMLTGEEISELLDAPTNTLYSTKDGILTLTTKANSNDVYITLSYDNISTKMNADTHKYMVVRYRTSQKSGTLFGLFLAAGSVSGATAESYKNFVMISDGAWHTAIVDLSTYGPWKGNLHNIRLDFIDNSLVNEGDSVDIAYIAFYQTLAEAQAAPTTP